jgi:micrococcal nuclease
MKKATCSIVLIACLFSCTEAGLPAAEYYGAVIAAAVDGDTVDVSFTGTRPADCAEKERVRLIGVNTPELAADPPEYYALEARNFTNQFWRKNVFLRFDSVSDKRDRYGRILCYVYIETVNENNLLNLLLIKGGYGKYYDAFLFEKVFMETFLQAETGARTSGIGLWGNS